MQRSFLAPLQRSLLALALACGASAAFAHGDMVPQAVDTSTLPQLGTKWRESNPYSSGDGHKEALRIGSSAYNQNCARCHGLEAISGGIAPDLRKFDEECAGYADAARPRCASRKWTTSTPAPCAAAARATAGSTCRRSRAR